MGSVPQPPRQLHYRREPTPGVCALPACARRVRAACLCHLLTPAASQASRHLTRLNTPRSASAGMVLGGPNYGPPPGFDWDVYDSWVECAPQPRLGSRSESALFTQPRLESPASSFWPLCVWLAGRRRRSLSLFFHCGLIDD